MDRKNKVNKMMALSPIAIVLLILVIFAQVGSATEMLRGYVWVLEHVGMIDWRIGIHAGSI
jgi:hypothetical protein